MKFSLHSQLSRFWCIVFNVSCIFTASVLAFSAVEHIRNPYAFLISILRYKFIGGALAEVSALLLPWFQLIIAVCLISRSCFREACFLGGGLLLCFSGVQFSALYRGLKIGCGCFGAASDRPISAFGVLQVLVLALCLLYSGLRSAPTVVLRASERELL